MSMDWRGTENENRRFIDWFVMWYQSSTSTRTTVKNGLCKLRRSFLQQISCCSWQRREKFRDIWHSWENIRERCRVEMRLGKLTRKSYQARRNDSGRNVSLTRPWTKEIYFLLVVESTTITQSFLNTTLIQKHLNLFFHSMKVIWSDSSPTQTRIDYDKLSQYKFNSRNGSQQFVAFNFKLVFLRKSSLSSLEINSRTFLTFVGETMITSLIKIINFNFRANKRGELVDET